MRSISFRNVIGIWVVEVGFGFDGMVVCFLGVGRVLLLEIVMAIRGEEVGKIEILPRAVGRSHDVRVVSRHVCRA